MILNSQTKAVIYCRVSTKEQVEEGNSLATQERNCREYALKHGYDIAQVFIEQGESAKTADRTELQKLLKTCVDRKQNIKAVIIYKIDRLSRNTDDYSYLRILLKRHGVEIKSSSEYFENTPAGRFMENIIANVAQFDNDVRTERSVGGMKEAIREGRYVWPAPVGYKNQKVNGKANIALSEKAAIVKRAFEFMAERKHTINAIYDSLCTMGLTTRSGKPISVSCFYKMIKNEVYCGWINKMGERHKGSFEPIISEALFVRVQQVMRLKTSPLHYKKDNEDFPLRRFIFHPENRKLTGSWSQGKKNKYAYYRFSKTRLYWPKNHLETLFCSFMDKFAYNEQGLIKLKREIVTRFGKSSSISKEKIDELLNKKKQLKEKESVLIQKNIKGVISDTLLKDQLAILDEEIWNIDNRLLQSDKSTFNLKKIFGFVDEYLITPSAVWKKMPLEIKLELQWFQFPHGVVFDGTRFRTPKISSLFNAKTFFSNQNSFKVSHEELNHEHTKSSKFSAFKNKKSIVWDEIEKELKHIEQLVTTKYKRSQEVCDVSFSASIPP